jgi:hypothetical protein
MDFRITLYDRAVSSVSFLALHWIKFIETQVYGLNKSAKVSSPNTNLLILTSDIEFLFLPTNHPRSVSLHVQATLQSSVGISFIICFSFRSGEGETWQSSLNKYYILEKPRPRVQYPWAKVFPQSLISTFHL